MRSGIGSHRIPLPVAGWIVCVLALFTSSGCATAPDLADRFAAPDAGFPDSPVRAILLYVPNRAVDLLEVCHFGFGLGFGLGFEVHPTRSRRFGLMAASNTGVAWLGRHTNPFQSAAFSWASREERERVDEEKIMWRIPRWDFGASVSQFAYQAYFGIALDELVDFVLGWSTYDLKRDDL